MCFQPFSISDGDMSATVFDQSLLFKHSSRYGDTSAAHAKHFTDELMRQFQVLRV
jgi:hypothetical protein